MSEDKLSSVCNLADLVFGRELAFEGGAPLGFNNAYVYLLMMRMDQGKGEALVILSHTQYFSTEEMQKIIENAINQVKTSILAERRRRLKFDSTKHKVEDINSQYFVADLTVFEQVMCGVHGFRIVSPLPFQAKLEPTIRQ